MNRHGLLSIALTSCLLLASPLSCAAESAAGAPYGPRNLPDRIVLTPGADSARQLAVSYRTDMQQTTSELQLAEAIDGPSIEAHSRTLNGHSAPLDSDNGPAMYHQVVLDGLMPDTAYLYRVKGAAGWSEWLQTRTASSEPKDFSFLYFGDLQNNILSHGARTLRQGLTSLAHPALALHAGDLVAQGDSLAHDDEWGQWNQAGSFHFAQVPQLVAAGNHEYVKHTDADGREVRQLGPHWSRQFKLPGNGAPGAEQTTYVSDYQGVRFIVLDGTSALDLGTLDSQSRWLEAQLAQSPARWNIVVQHQPIFTCARHKNPLEAHWRPIYQRYKVDLVLQGHDHCYSRISDSHRNPADDSLDGPVYMVSVTGTKMYAVNARAREQAARLAEDTQLYQQIHVSEHALNIQAYTASGRLYDAFAIERDAQGRNHLREVAEPLPAARLCHQGQGPDGTPCTARAK